MKVDRPERQEEVVHGMDDTGDEENEMQADWDRPPSEAEDNAVPAAGSEWSLSEHYDDPLEKARLHLHSIQIGVRFSSWSRWLSRTR